MALAAVAATSTTATSRSDVRAARGVLRLAGLLGGLVPTWAAVAQQPAQQPARQPLLPDAPAVLASAAWQECEVALDVTLRRAWLPKLGPGPQSLCVLTIAPASSTTLRVAVPRGLVPTTRQARTAGALVAWNGGFFLPNGRPRGLRRSGGVELAPAGAESLATIGWRHHAYRVAGSHDDWQAWPEVLEAGPRLLQAGAVLDHGDKQRSTRHPRTAMGVAADGSVVVVTADGRTPLARGLSLEELGEVLLALGCQDAINLDGGGSTTLWAEALEVATAGSSGIANHPCDNRRFDAAGERAVADVVLLFGTRAVVVDDDDLLVERGTLHTASDGSGQLGGAFRWAAAAEPVRASYRLSVPRSGRYRVERRGVVAPGLVDAAVQWFDTVAVPADGDGVWQTVAEHTFAAGPARLPVASVGGRPIVLDAVRLVAID